MQPASRPPAIKESKPHGMNKGLVDCLADITRGCYADVIVQFVYSIPSDRTPGMPCLLVWDGSEWPHKSLPLVTVEGDERPEQHPSDPALKERAKGRMVTIFSYDFDNQCKRPIESGDWLYLENLHCLYQSNSPLNSLVMHNNNIRPRQIYRLELPMARGLFYGEKWQNTMKRVADAQPLPAAVIELQQLQQAAAPAARAVISPQRTPSLAAFDRLHTMILEEMLREGVRMPSSDAVLARIAKSAVAMIKTVAAPAAATAAAAPLAAAPPAAAPAAAVPNQQAPAAAPPVAPAAVAPNQAAPAAVQRAAAAAPAAKSPNQAASPKFKVPALPTAPKVANRSPSKAAAPAAPTAAAKSPKRGAPKDAAPASAAPTATSPKRAAPKAAAAASTTPAVTSPKRAAAPKSAAVAPRAAKVALPPAASTAVSSSSDGRRQMQQQQHCPMSQPVEAAATAVAGPTTRAAAAAATNDAAGQSPTRKSTRKRSAPITHPEEESAAPSKRSPRQRNDNSIIVIDDSDEEEEEVREKKVGGKKAGDGRTVAFSSKPASPEKKAVPRKPIRPGTPPPGAKNRLRPKAEVKKE